MKNSPPEKAMIDGIFVNLKDTIFHSKTVILHMQAFITIAFLGFVENAVTYELTQDQKWMMLSGADVKEVCNDRKEKVCISEHFTIQSIYQIKFTLINVIGLVHHYLKLKNIILFPNFYSFLR